MYANVLTIQIYNTKSKNLKPKMAFRLVTCVCYHIYSSQDTIFYFSDSVYFSAGSPTYEMLRWAALMVHYVVSGL